jgi:hypothetical protein
MEHLSRAPGGSEIDTQQYLERLQRSIPPLPTFRNLAEGTDYRRTNGDNVDRQRIKRVREFHPDGINWAQALSEACAYDFKQTTAYYFRAFAAMFLGCLVVHEVATAALVGSGETPATWWEAPWIFPKAGPSKAAATTFYSIADDQLDTGMRALTFGSTWVMWVLWVLYAGLLLRATYAAFIAATSTFTHCTRFSYYNPLMYLVPQGIVHVVVPFMEMEIYYQCLYSLAVLFNWLWSYAANEMGGGSPNMIARADAAYAAVEHLYTGTRGFWFAASDAFRKHISSNLTHLEDLGDLGRTSSW